MTAALLLALALQSAPVPGADTAAAATPVVDRRLVITLDDLPWASLPTGRSDAAIADPKSAPALDIGIYSSRLTAAIKREGAPVVGFVNEAKLLDGDRASTVRVHWLRDWLDAGAELGNHTYSHADLHAVGLQNYEDEILRGELFLKPLLEERAQEPRWFRAPYLRAGRSAEEKAALAAFLAEHGYTQAPVTVDTSDWIWASAYRKTLLNPGLQDGLRQETLDRLRHEYVPYMLAKIDYYERQAIALLGYNPPQILLMHANELNADCYRDLLAAIRMRGYRFIDLDEALQDPAYRRPDGYTGRYGPSWIHRWALAAGRPKSSFAGEPPTPEWVMQLAGVDSE